MPRIDLNCDLGEGAGHDAELMPLITSANIACGAHAGDEASMRETLALALKHGVAIGAHPGFADRPNFGRLEIDLSPEDAAELVCGQLLKLRALGPVRHIKLHGALYHMASRDAVLAGAISEAVADIAPKLAVFAPPASRFADAARTHGLRVYHEVFADRTYQSDGTLTPRSHPNAQIQDEHAGAAQVIRMIREGRVRTIDGSAISIAADTVCVHGDGSNPVAFVRRLREALIAAGVEIAAPGE